MTIKDTSSRHLLITALVLVVLQGANLVGIAVNRSDLKHHTDDQKVFSKDLDEVRKDYVPLWFLEGLQENNNYQTQEILATIKCDPVKIKQINDKYMQFQKQMINTMAQMRGGMSNTYRSIKNKER